jgi:DNA-binding phage protein
MSKRTTPKHTSILDELHFLLDEAIGLHSRMAREAGVPQTVVSRTYLRAGEPRITTAERMLVWLRANRSRFDVMRKESAAAVRSASRAGRACNQIAAR